MYSDIHSSDIIHKLFIEDLICDKDYSKYLGYSNKQDRQKAPAGLEFVF